MIFCHLVLRHPADSAGFQRYVPPLLSRMLGRGCPCGEPARLARRRSRHGALCPPIEGVTVVGRRGRHPTDGIGQTCGSPAPGNCLVAAPKSRQVQLLVGWLVGRGWLPLPGGIGAAMGLTDPTDPGGEGDAVEIGGPLPAAPIEMARSGCAHVEPCAAQEAASEQGPGTGQGGVAAAAGRPPKAAGEESQDEPLVSAMTTKAFPPPRWRPPARPPTRSRTTSSRSAGSRCSTPSRRSSWPSGSRPGCSPRRNWARASPEWHPTSGSGAARVVRSGTERTGR